MKTLIISSSLSQSSRSFILCTEVLKLLSKNNVKCKIIDARNILSHPTHRELTAEMLSLSEQIKQADNIIIGMGVHCYSVNDSLKILLDNCFKEATGKFFGILCAAGGEKSYLASMHLTQICMNEWRMIQLPRIVFSTEKDFKDNKINSSKLFDKINIFCQEFKTIGKKLLI